jgi:hypothetical protein
MLRLLLPSRHWRGPNLVVHEERLPPVGEGALARPLAGHPPPAQLSARLRVRPAARRCARPPEKATLATRRGSSPSSSSSSSSYSLIFSLLLSHFSSKMEGEASGVSWQKKVVGAWAPAAPPLASPLFRHVHVYIDLSTESPSCGKSATQYLRPKRII